MAKPQTEEVEETEVTEIPASVPPVTVLRQAIREAGSDPKAVAEMAISMYSKGYREGLKDGLSLDRRPEKKKGWLD